MTYPPQQPGPHGQPQPSPYGGQPRPPAYPQQSSYQGLGSYPSGPSDPPPPKKSHIGTIVAIALVALLVLGGGGASVYLLTKKKDNTSNSAPPGQQTPGNTTSSEPTDDNSSTPPPNDTPASVQQAYIEAYESKKFGSVVGGACDAYKEKFGTSTADLEKRLAPYDMKATADGTPEVNGGTASAKIDLELTKGAETKKTKIKIKIIKERGSWKFCGEGEA
jgi:hypothetical protein